MPASPATAAQAAPAAPSLARRAAPLVLMLTRLVLGPLLYLDAGDGAPSRWFLAGFVLAALTDIFDGVLARRMGVVTARLRELDGQIDVWFYAWVLAATWAAHREWVLASRWPLALMLGLQALAWAFDLAKYRRFSNYHAYTARVWGGALFILILTLYGAGDAGPALWLAVAAGAACTLEEIAITAVLPRWQHDVPSVLHALELRREWRRE